MSHSWSMCELKPITAFSEGGSTRNIMDKNSITFQDFSSISQAFAIEMLEVSGSQKSNDLQNIPQKKVLRRKTFL